MHAQLLYKSLAVRRESFDRLRCRRLNGRFKKVVGLVAGVTELLAFARRVRSRSVLLGNTGKEGSRFFFLSLRNQRGPASSNDCKPEWRWVGR